MRYDEPDAGEWVQPKRRGYKLACCDCGLVHKMNFRLVKSANAGRTIQFQVFRDNKATGAIRRHMQLKSKKNA